MRKLVVATALALVACTPGGAINSQPAVVTANFDPAATPPVVPSPNDLAFQGGHLSIPLAANASPADHDFATYLATLDGFPPDSPAVATFAGNLNAASVTPQSVVVLDLTSGAPVDYANTLGVGIPGSVSVGPPALGWTAGHQYAVAIIGGASGVTGVGGAPVVGSPTWGFVRSPQSLVTCTDPSVPATCVTATQAIPSTLADPAARLADQTAKALQLEALRVSFAPLISTLISLGYARDDIALAWTFHVVDLPTLVFEPSALPVPQVPSPNDLAFDPAAGVLAVPIDPSSSPAQQEFTRDYLNTLDGFPAGAHARAAVAGPPLDPATVNAGTVLVMDLADGSTPAAPISWDAPTQSIVVSPPGTGWTKGHQYALVVVGGDHGVKGVAGQTVAASDVWALARCENPLVTCADPTDPTTCSSTLTLASISSDQAVQLEGLRLQLKPLLDQLAASGLDRVDVAVAWTFTVLSRGELTFDPANGVIPFPNDILLVPASADGTTPQHVNLPAGSLPSALLTGLNSLDGFSTSAPIVSENGLATGALDLGSIDPATLPGAVALSNLMPGGAAPEFTACLDCVTSAPAGSGQPQTLQIVPQVPLDERSTFAAFVTTAVKDTDGKPVAPATTFALARLSQPLVDAGGKSQVQDVTDAQAQALEPLRQAMKPLFDGLDAQGLKRTQLGLAWTFTTQTTTSALPAIHGVPAALGQLGVLSDQPDVVLDETATIKTAMGALGAPSGNIGHVFAGTIPNAFLLTGPGGTLNPKAPRLEHIPFILLMPDPTKFPAPGNGYPVVYFNHGITRSRTDVLAVANALCGAGFAALATDVVWHGERSTCVGSHVATGQTSDDASCAKPLTQQCDQTAASPTYGKCVLRQGASPSACDAASTGGLPPDLFCETHGEGNCNPLTQKCVGADFLLSGTSPAISGWNYIDPSNFFATRDNFREQVSDLAQLYRVVAATGATSLSGQVAAANAGAGLDCASFHFLGMSLGGMLGTLYSSAAPEVGHVVLNVPGGDPAEILLTSTSLAPLRDALIAGLAQEGISPGTPAFDQFVGIAKWVLDPADPSGAAPLVLNAPLAPANRAALLQYIDGDQTIPNPTTLELIGSANRTGVAKSIVIDHFSYTGTGNPHGFLLDPSIDAAATQQAQTDAATFLFAGALQ